MGSIVEKLESELQELNSKEKAALAHYLIEELDGRSDAGVSATLISKSSYIFWLLLLGVTCYLGYNNGISPSI